MTTTDIREQDFHAYLLGSLPQDDAERFDELSVTSDEFVEALEAAEVDLVDAYLNGELSPEKRLLFEQNYKRTETGRGKIRFADTLQRFGREGLSERAVRVDHASSERSQGLMAFLGQYLRWGLAAAAAAAVVVGGWFYFQSRSPVDVADESTRPANVTNSNIAVPETSRNIDNVLEPPAPEVAAAGNKSSENQEVGSETNGSAPNTKETGPKRAPALRVFAFALSPQMRSSAQLPTITIPQNSERATVRLELEPTGYSAFQLSLLDRSNRVIWSAKNARPTGSGGRRSVYANIPGRLLPPGTYRFSVSGIRPQYEPENVGDYPFKIGQ